ncbi:MAG: hypothetical protein U0793_03465 [Gemmataceae bacterium]
MNKFIELPNVKAKAVHFQSPFAKNHRYVVLAEKMDYLEFLRTYNQGPVECKAATGVNLDGCEERFFMVYVEDCFDPPIAIVRADSEQDAEELFVDELPWAHITEPDLNDYDPETLVYGPSGQPYDSESVRVHPVRMVHVELAEGDDHAGQA